MITVLLVNMNAETIIRRYDTNSFDEALKLLLDDWMNGKIIWEFEDTNNAITPEWLKRYGQPEDGIEIMVEEDVVTHTWNYCGERKSDDEIVSAFMVKSAPVEASELPTKSTSP